MEHLEVCCSVSKYISDTDFYSDFSSWKTLYFIKSFKFPKTYCIV